jgi:hypothetical protein
VLPEFLKEGCLKKDGLGNIQFDFGGDVRVEKLEDLLTIDESELRVRMNEVSLTSKRENINFFVYLLYLNSHMYTGNGCEGTNKCKIRKKLQLNRGGELCQHQCK